MKKITILTLILTLPTMSSYVRADEEGLEACIELARLKCADCLDRASADYESDSTWTAIECIFVGPLCIIGAAKDMDRYLTACERCADDYNLEADGCMDEFDGWE